MSHRHSVVAVGIRAEHLRWLGQALKDEGELIVADQPVLERVLQIVDVSGAPVVLVGLSPANVRQDTALIEGLVAAKPLLTVIAFADQAENALVIAAMRAGARDFVTADLRGAEFASLIQRFRERTPHAALGTRAENGQVTALVCARPGYDTPMLALHLAIAFQGQVRDRYSLLLDLGIPHGDTLAFLGIAPNYSFVDAVRSLRRLDATFINSAFAHHKSGLHVLAMPEEAEGTGDLTSADVYVLLSTLRRYFRHIVVNLGGVPRSDFLHLLLRNTDNILVLVEQSVPSCRQNMQLVKNLHERNLPLGGAGLVIDRFLAKVPPDADTIARGFDLPVLATLPPSGLARLTAMNSGESLFDCAPRDPYLAGVRRVAERLAGERAARAANRGSALAWLWSRFGLARG